MSDLNWCASCGKATNPFSESLYCSEQCLRNDALRHHPLLGYNYREFVDFPRPHSSQPYPATLSLRLSSASLASAASTSSSAPSLTSTRSSSDDSLSSLSHLSPPKFNLHGLPPMTSSPSLTTMPMGK